MACCVGKWEITSSDNFEEFMQAIGVDAEKRAAAQKFLTSGMTNEFSNNGDNWSLKTTTANGAREITFKLGEEFETSTLDGRPVKVTYTADGDKLIEVQKGDGFECKHTRTVEGDSMTMVMEGNGVTCTRKYKKTN